MDTLKVQAIIQARVGSTRLPKKSLLKIFNKTIIEHVIMRVKRAKNVQGIIVAIPATDENREIANLAHKCEVMVYKGSENDVLDRFYQAAKMYKIKHIIRITADCPLIDPIIIDNVISRYFETSADYCSNILERSFPDGEDLEVFSFDVLEKAWKNAKLASEREHVTSWIWKRPNAFNLVNFKNSVDLSRKRWTLDRKEDFEFIKKIFKSLYPKNPEFGMKDALELVRNNPEIEDINKKITLNEGYLKSLEKDRSFKKGRKK